MNLGGGAACKMHIHINTMALVLVLQAACLHSTSVVSQQVTSSLLTPTPMRASQSGEQLMMGEPVTTHTVTHAGTCVGAITASGFG